MKKYLTLLILIVSIGCTQKPQFYINGKPYYRNLRCIENKTETKCEWHYGYNMFRGKWEYHYGPNTKTECVKYAFDTIEIK